MIDKQQAIHYTKINKTEGGCITMNQIIAVRTAPINDNLAYIVRSYP